MSQTREGAAKARATLLARDPDYFKNIGRKGGSVSRPETRRFYMDREAAKQAGTLGGLRATEKRRAKRGH